MKRHRPARIMFLIMTFTAALSVGCETSFVGSAAQASFSTFVNSVVTTAVNNTLNPGD